MGHAPYLAVRQSARSRLLELAPRISGDRRVPLNVLISQQGKVNHGRLAVIMFSICTVVLGIILSFVPWLDYIIFRELKLWNGSISYSYWQKPGVTRLTKVYIFNVSNPQGFLENGERPKLVEVGPFVYSWNSLESRYISTVIVGSASELRFADDTVVMAESMEDLSTMLEGLNRVSQQVGLKMNMDKTKVMSNVHVVPTPISVGNSTLEVVDEEDMEKVNIKFHDNDTVTYQHNKILRFVPELSVDKNLKFVVPNIPLLTVTSFSPNMAGWLFNILASGLSMTYRERAKPFVEVTAEELVFGYNDPLVSLAHIFYPKGKRPNSQMGLLLARNGTLDEVSTIYTGQKAMDRFGYIDKINGLDHLPHWKDKPCNNIRASEGSFFPPRSVTKSDIVHIYDKDLCRILPLKHRKDVYKDGIQAGVYTPPASTFECADVNPDNKCYCLGEECPPRGLQNISPCQYNAPVYLSYPHFYEADPTLLEKFDGLKPNKKKHETYFMIQPKIGVPLEGFVRVQLNIKVDRAAGIRVNNIHKFPSIIFPVMWVEEGIHEITTPIWRWIFLATTVGPIAAPLITYSMIALGLLTIAIVFIKAYKNFVLGQNTLEFIDIGRETIRSSTLKVYNSQKFLHNRDSTYQPLNQNQKVHELVFVKDLSKSVEEFKTILRPEFVRSTFGDVERESLLRSDNAFILSEHRHKRFSLGK